MTEMPPLPSPLAAEAARMRDAGALGRSDVLVRLFDFLLQCSLENRAPKEIEIAQEVFGKTGEATFADDASVRVYIHRLRRKIEEFYGPGTWPGEQLAIPRGEYRLVLVAGAEGAETDVTPALPLPEPKRGGERGGRGGRIIWIAFAALILANVAGWLLWLDRRPRDSFAQVEATSFWRGFDDSRYPKLIVTGDYFIFGEARRDTGVARLVREFQINSREDLDTFIMNQPEYFGRYVDLDLHYLPISTAQALQTLLPLTSAAAQRGAFPLRLTTMSELTAERLKNTSMVYIGLLSGLGLLRDSVFDMSGFSIGSSYDELVDRRTKRHYTSDFSEVAEGGKPSRDYSYIASMRGPTGNRILIIAGTRDSAVMQAAEVVRDPAQLALLAKRTGNAPGFEALFEVRTMGNMNLDSSLVLARPLRDGVAWRANPTPAQQFPDQLPSEARGEHALP